jgi:hypothetical protein
MTPKHFKKIAFSPSESASGGIFIGWNESLFSGQVLSPSMFVMTINFTSTLNAEQWRLTMVYGPCQGQERQNFIDWVNSLSVDDDINWLFVGDFNFYRSLENRNKDRGNM